MIDYSKREDAIEQARRNWIGEGEWIASTKVQLLKILPTADVRENVKNEWIDEPVYKQTMDGKTWDGFTYCSKCKEKYEYGYRSNFCPNCGVDMRGKV